MKTARDATQRDIELRGALNGELDKGKAERMKHYSSKGRQLLQSSQQN